MIDIDLITGRVAEARWRPSPHYNARPGGELPSLLVVHSISLPEGQYGTPFVDDLFLGRLNTAAHPTFASLEGVRVSAHLLVARNGELTQYVSLNERAWHAGESRFDGRDDVNDFSIGVELEGTVVAPFTTAQYCRLAQVHRGLRAAYRSIDGRPVVGHSDIAPERKQDPGTGFDWLRWSTMAGVQTV
ncbi:MAG: 1,6-anhydro-N-acetylmuramyl-L-alanine amidase AmpD [Gammaproteobacteria bacterium]